MFFWNSLVFSMIQAIDAYYFHTVSSLSNKELCSSSLFSNKECIVFFLKCVFSLRIFFQQCLIFFQVVDINFYVLKFVLNQYFLQVTVFTQQIGFMCLLSLFLSLLTKLLRVYSWAVTPPSTAAKLAHAGLIAILNVIDCQTISVILKSIKTAFNIVISSS